MHGDLFAIYLYLTITAAFTSGFLSFTIFYLPVSAEWCVHFEWCVRNVQKSILVCFVGLLRRM